MSKFKKLTLVVAVLSSFLMACEKDNSDSSQPVAVAPAASNDCLINPVNNPNCNPNVYNTNGFQPYPYGYSSNPYYQHQNYNYFCGCPAGYRPVYNGGYGLGCIQNSYIQVGFYGYVNWYWGTGGLNQPQDPYIGGAQNLGAGYNNCYGTVVSTCDTRVINQCGAGNICRPIGGGSALGTCVRESF